MLNFHILLKALGTIPLKLKAVQIMRYTWMRNMTKVVDIVNTFKW